MNVNYKNIYKNHSVNQSYNLHYNPNKNMLHHICIWWPIIYKLKNAKSCSETIKHVNCSYKIMCNSLSLVSVTQCKAVINYGYQTHEVIWHVSIAITEYVKFNTRRRPWWCHYHDYGIFWAPFSFWLLPYKASKSNPKHHFFCISIHLKKYYNKNIYIFKFTNLLCAKLKNF